MSSSSAVLIQNFTDFFTCYDLCNAPKIENEKILSVFEQITNQAVISHQIIQMNISQEINFYFELIPFIIISVKKIILSNETKFSHHQIKLSSLICNWKENFLENFSTFIINCSIPIKSLQFLKIAEAILIDSENIQELDKVREKVFFYLIEKRCNSLEVEIFLSHCIENNLISIEKFKQYYCFSSELIQNIEHLDRLFIDIKSSYLIVGKHLFDLYKHTQKDLLLGLNNTDFESYFSSFNPIQSFKLTQYFLEEFYYLEEKFSFFIHTLLKFQKNNFLCFIDQLKNDIYRIDKMDHTIHQIIGLLRFCKKHHQKEILPFLYQSISYFFPLYLGLTSLSTNEISWRDDLFVDQLTPLMVSDEDLQKIIHNLNLNKINSYALFLDLKNFPLITDKSVYFLISYFPKIIFGNATTYSNLKKLKIHNQQSAENFIANEIIFRHAFKAFYCSLKEIESSKQTLLFFNNEDFFYVQVLYELGTTYPTKIDHFNVNQWILLWIVARNYQYENQLLEMKSVEFIRGKVGGNWRDDLYFLKKCINEKLINQKKEIERILQEKLKAMQLEQESLEFSKAILRELLKDFQCANDPLGFQKLIEHPCIQWIFSSNASSLSSIISLLSDCIIRTKKLYSSNFLKRRIENLKSFF